MDNKEIIDMRCGEKSMITPRVFGAEVSGCFFAIIGSQIPVFNDKYFQQKLEEFLSLEVTSSPWPTNQVYRQPNKFTTGPIVRSNYPQFLNPFEEGHYRSRAKKLTVNLSRETILAPLRQDSSTPEMDKKVAGFLTNDETNEKHQEAEEDVNIEEEKAVNCQQNLEKKKKSKHALKKLKSRVVKTLRSFFKSKKEKVIAYTIIA